MNAYLKETASFPMKEDALPPNSEWEEFQLIALFKLKGIHSGWGDNFDQARNYLESLRILRSWNGLNGCVLKLPITVLRQNSHTTRFPSRELRRNENGEIPSLVDYLWAKYTVRPLYSNALVIRDANGCILPLEMVRVVISTPSRFTEFRIDDEALLIREVRTVCAFPHNQNKSVIANARNILVPEEIERHF